ncbi:hypothetical protein M408DRAFT_333641 [Serendipita vermifera MAFF 305830]|uniref:Uncharacterized protein n=1 Tax=Serendipita vermifera MAFF 305830 TaxID=933852 RepID=A0A0C2WUR6_SERVB|nr:hypothetical protein M408DRAFT_334198 [Serendipita vermifera MAFF 305830]KIM21127.1 hypothetical protein M408DRAFT_333641 [Serendipita vermifera MAFF 305830]
MSTRGRWSRRPSSLFLFPQRPNTLSTQRSPSSSGSCSCFATTGTPTTTSTRGAQGTQRISTASTAQQSFIPLMLMLRRRRVA